MACRHHPTCPGCPLLDRPYAEQLALKRARLVDAVQPYGHLGLPPVPEVVGAPRIRDYRHRLKLPVHVGRDRVHVGLYDARHHVLDTPDCAVITPRLREGLAALRTWLADVPGVHSVDLRASDATGELQLVLAVQGGSLRGGKGGARKLIEAVPGLVSVAVSTADPEGKRVMGRSPHLIAGAPFVEERIGTTRYHLHPGAFFQVDPASAAHIHALVARYVGDAATVLDLYAGVGAYALALAEGRRRVVAVEEVPTAARSAAECAPPNVEVIASRVEDLQLDEPFDVVILNPARRGSDPDTLARVARLAERAVYVSCGPETLARDLDILASQGMHVTDWQPVDLFPQTPEVETVVHLQRGRPLRTWEVRGGRAGGPWHGHPSGAVGRAHELIALVIHDPGPGRRIPGGSFERLAVVATHGLIRLSLDAPPEVALSALARRGHPTAGLDPRTRRFFAEKAGLLRPFVHVARAGAVRAPLHGDLVAALRALGAPERVIGGLC